MPVFCNLCMLQVLFHRNDYAAVSLYAAPCLILAIAAILLPIETKGKSMKVLNLHYKTDANIVLQ